MKNKGFNVFLLLFCVSITLLACKKEVNPKFEPGTMPDIAKATGDYNLDFAAMHNFVIDSISADYNPFFFIKDGCFDISGDNKNRVITVTCTCQNGTLRDDVDLFLSLVLNYIGFNAAEQDFRFANPRTDNEGSYLDFGTIFNTFDLVIKATTESGEVLHDDYIKKGNKIPVESRYWSE